MMQELQTITGDVIGRLFFGEKFDKYRIQGKSLNSYLAELAPRVGDEFRSPIYLLFGMKGVNAKVLPRHKMLIDDIEALNEFARAIINKKSKKRRIQET